MSIPDTERDSVFIMMPDKSASPPEKLLPYVYTARTGAEWADHGFTPCVEVEGVDEDDQPYDSVDTVPLEIEGYLVDFEYIDILEEWDFGDAMDGTNETRYLSKPQDIAVLVAAGVNPKFFQFNDSNLEIYLEAEKALAEGSIELFIQYVDKFIAEASGYLATVAIQRKTAILGESDLGASVRSELAQYADDMEYLVSSNRIIPWVRQAVDENDYVLILDIAEAVIDGIDDLIGGRRQPRLYGDSYSRGNAYREKIKGYFIDRLGSTRRVIGDELFKQNLGQPEALEKVLCAICLYNPKKQARIEKLFLSHIGRPLNCAVGL